MIHRKWIIGVPLHNLLKTLDCTGIVKIVKMIEGDSILWIVRLENDLWSRRMSLEICLPGTSQAEQKKTEKQSMAGTQAGISLNFECT